jgi:formylglycine-generating enzyme required for sulfatase activity
LKYFLFPIIIVLFAACQPSSESTSGPDVDGVQVDELSSKYAQSINEVTKDPVASKDFSGMVVIPGGSFMMGGNNFQSRPDELPKHPTRVDSFYMDQSEVTNAQFSSFVNATGYITTAERPIDLEEIMKQLPPGTPEPDPEMLKPASLIFSVPAEFYGFEYVNWWEIVPGASWKNPLGPDSNLDDIMDHPVVHISYYDALAYARWAGKRLPTEAEWEYAARGGLIENVYPWGNEPIDSGSVKANYFQGTFPLDNTNKDNFFTTSPSISFLENGFGLFGMAGTVWEWTSDWYRPDYYEYKLNNNVVHNPIGPEDSFDPQEPTVPKKTLRGGSFLCNDSYCSGYRVASRMKVSMDTGLQHTGFRCVRDIKKN